jgi:signal peptidase II
VLDLQAAGGAHALNRLAARLYAIAAAVIAVDQVTKVIAVARLDRGQSVAVIDGVLHWTLERNPGAAFSVFTRYPLVFTILASVVSVAIAISAPRVRSGLNSIALGLVLGGALGNLVDRMARAPGIGRGWVVDFIDFRVWPVFNVADACIVIGAMLLVLSTFLADRKRPAPTT